jgi:glycerol-3-phosphate acyltransferase PlsY
VDAVRSVALIAIAYLVGSLSPAYILGRALRGVDLRDVGSRNLGARNAGRVLGRWWGVTVWALDMLKGAIPVLLATASGATIPVAIACGAASVCGHNWPLYHRFRGGRGASTVMGATFALLPLEMAIGLSVWVIVSLVSDSLYLGGLIAYPVTTALAFAFGNVGLKPWSPLLMGLPLMARHVPAVVEQIRKRKLYLP